MVHMMVEIAEGSRDKITDPGVVAVAVVPALDTTYQKACRVFIRTLITIPNHTSPIIVQKAAEAAEGAVVTTARNMFAMLKSTALEGGVNVKNTISTKAIGITVAHEMDNNTTTSKPSNNRF